MSTNRTSGGNKQPHKLRVVQRLAKVELTSDEVKGLTALRLALKANGVSPIPNRDKRAMYKGWNGLDPDEAEIRSWINPRASFTIYPATGVLIVNKLLTIDKDIPDHGIKKEINAAIAKLAPQLFGDDGALERGRDDGSAKSMLFCRRAGLPFTVRSGKWSADPKNDEAPSFMVEIFASERDMEGRARRQVGAFGAHTIDDETGEVKVRYKWNGASLEDVPLDELPELDEATALAIIAEVDRILEGHGLKPVEGYRSGKLEHRNVYDLDDSTRFDGVDFGQISIDELTDLYWQNQGVGLQTRCSGSFTGIGGTRQDRCQVGWSGGSRDAGHITIEDYATYVTHRPASEKPVTPEDSSELLGEVMSLLPDTIEADDGSGGSGDGGGGGGGPQPGPSFEDRWNAALGEMPALGFTELAFATALSTLLKDRLCYSPKEKQWLRFVSPRWVEETSTRVMTLMVGRFCHMVPLPRNAAGMKKREKLESQKHHSAIEKMMQAMLEHKEGFDLDPYMICGPKRAVDLKTGRSRAGRPEDWLRNSLMCDPSDGENCPLWLKFLGEITLGDASLQRFHKQWMGLSLCGDPTHQQLAYFHGGGRNGKNTFIDLMKRIAGDYGYKANAEVFMDQKFERHSTDIWALRNKRMIIASEVKKGSAWNENLIKSLTGDDEITARAMRMDNVTFSRTQTITIIGNNEPDIKDVDVAIVSRLIMVPFDLTVAKEDIDPELPRKLLAEAPGILRWALNGLLDVRANGLIRPDRIREKTKDYFASQDAKQSFIDEHIEVDTDPNGKGIDNTTLYRRWKSFAEIHNARPGNINSMGWIAEPTGAVKLKKTKGVIWTGIKFAETPLNDLFNS